MGDVDFKLYHGPSPKHEIPSGWYHEFLKYNLVKPDGTETLSLAPVPTEYVTPIRLVRAKCYALVGLWNLIKGQTEKLDVHNNPLVSEHVTIEEATIIYADIFNIPRAQARVLAQFKKDELMNRLKKLKLIELEIETKIANCLTENIIKAAQDPETSKSLEDAGNYVRIKGSKDFARYIEEESNKWKSIAEKANIKSE